MFQRAGPPVISALTALNVPLLPPAPQAISLIQFVVTVYWLNKTELSVENVSLLFKQYKSFFPLPPLFSAHKHLFSSTLIHLYLPLPFLLDLFFSSSSYRPSLLLLILSFISSLLRAAAPASNQHQCLRSARRVRARGLCYTSMCVSVCWFLHILCVCIVPVHHFVSNVFLSVHMCVGMNLCVCVFGPSAFTPQPQTFMCLYFIPSSHFSFHLSFYLFTGPSLPGWCM